MTTLELLKNEILNFPKLFTNNGKLNPHQFRQDSEFLKSSIRSSIINLTDFLNETVKFPQRIYCIMNDITSIQQCDKCSNPVSFTNYVKGYKTFCGNVCSAEHNNKQRERTSLLKYGTKNPYQSERIKKKIKETNVTKYGTEYPSRTDKCKEKVKQTCLSRYGVTSYKKTNECTNKIKKTSMTKYGVESYSQTDECKDKVKDTSMCLFGVTNFTKTLKYKIKSRKTCVEKYGTEHYFQSDDYRIKSKDTNLQKYNVEYYNQQHLSKNTLEKLQNKDWMIHQQHNNKMTLKEIAEDLGDVQPSTVGKHYKKLGINVIRYSGQSIPEKDLANYITHRHTTNIQTSVRNIITPLEIDIYLPEYQLAIEYNGKYWHRPERYDGYDEWLEYHQLKIDLCEKQGIRLLHLWENFGNHEELIDNAINGIVNNNLYTIYETIYK